MYACMYVYMYVCMYVCILVFMYVCTYLYVTYIRIYIVHVCAVEPFRIKDIVQIATL